MMRRTEPRALLALADRCEREEPSRELDELIDYELFERPDGDWCPRFTFSLDAAVTICPAGYIWDVASTGQAWVMDDTGEDLHVTASGKTEALALCAAALRARASIPLPHGDNT